MTKPDCYSCKHRRSLHGNTHSACAHPKTGVDLNDPILELFVLLGVKTVPTSVDMHEDNEDGRHIGWFGTSPAAPAQIHVEGDNYGIAKGWFSWPFNFDPVWLIACDGFEPNEIQQEGK